MMVLSKIWRLIMAWISDVLQVNELLIATLLIIELNVHEMILDKYWNVLWRDKAILIQCICIAAQTEVHIFVEMLTKLKSKNSLLYID